MILRCKFFIMLRIRMVTRLSMLPRPLCSVSKNLMISMKLATKLSKTFSDNSNSRTTRTKWPFSLILVTPLILSITQRDGSIKELFQNHPALNMSTGTSLRKFTQLRLKDFNGLLTSYTLKRNIQALIKTIEKFNQSMLTSIWSPMSAPSS